jgi:hypothetical protein
MSEYLFGAGPGHLSAKVARIAKQEGAVLNNYTDPGCSCGYGCNAGCKANRRHWFSIPNRGNPFDQQRAERVLAAVESIK